MENIYLLYGENYKKIQDERKKIIKKYSDDTMGVSILDMNKSSLDDAINGAYISPFFSDYNIIVLTNLNILAQQSKVDKELITKEEKDDPSCILKYLDNPLESTVLIMEVPYKDIDNKNEVVKEISKRSNVVVCKYPTEKELGEAIDELIIDRNFRIDSLARVELIKRISENIEAYEVELEKLFNLKADEKEIKIEDVKSLISSNPQSFIYELSSAILTKDKEKGYRIYDNLISNGYNPLQILSFLINKFEDYLIVKELLRGKASKLEIANYFKINEGRAYYLINDVREISYSFIKTILSKLKELDYNLKVDFKYGDDNSLPLELFFLEI